MLHFVKQFKRKKTTFENFFVQKTNAEYTVTDNAQEAFPEKPCGSAVKAVVPCLLKINLHFSKPPPTENGSWNTGNGQCTKVFFRKPCGRTVKPVVPCLLKKILHFSKPHLRKTAVGIWATDKGVFKKRPVFNLRYVPFSARRKTQLHFEGLNSQKSCLKRKLKSCFQNLQNL